VYFRRIQAIKKKVALRYQVSSLKEQALRSQMNPHFIFNSLNAIQELIVTENYTASFEYLSKFSKLLRHVLHASEKNLLPLSKEIEITRLYIELEGLRFKNLFKYNISVSDEIDVENTPFPTLLLQPFVENAIWHGLLPKDGIKKLDIAFVEKENSLVCTIKDNGIGRQIAQMIKQKKLGAHNSESRGIQMTTQRLETLQLIGEASGSINISDIREPDGRVGGTMVEIIIISNENL
jgi:LytS/YehU family sensor histidine kinase